MVIDCLEYTNSEISVKFSILMVNNVNWFHHICALSSKLKSFCQQAAVFKIREIISNKKHRIIGVVVEIRVKCHKN